MQNRRAVVLVSGSGTNMESIYRSCKAVNILGVFADRDCYGTERAEGLGLYAQTIKKDFFKELSEFIHDNNIEIVLLAGFLKILPKEFIENAPPILNIHPSLLPKYGGKGCYGEHVHKKVLAARDEYSGATVHLVNEGIDSGSVIMQSFVCIRGLKTVEEIQKKVLTTEHKVYSMAISDFVRRM